VTDSGPCLSLGQIQDVGGDSLGSMGYSGEAQGQSPSTGIWRTKSHRSWRSLQIIFQLRQWKGLSIVGGQELGSAGHAHSGVQGKAPGGGSWDKAPPPQKMTLFVKICYFFTVSRMK